MNLTCCGFVLVCRNLELLFDNITCVTKMEKTSTQYLSNAVRRKLSLEGKFD